MIGKLLAVFAILFFSPALFAQLTMPPHGGNKKASVSERIGITDVAINYNRPAIKGREGKIWNELVHAGFKNLGFGTSKAAPWRAGANENTTISFTTDARVGGNEIKAGTYGLFAAMGTGEATLIFSYNHSSWGSFYYDPKEDAVTISVKTVPLTESVERLKFEFTDETDSSATVSLIWEKLKIPFRIEVDYVKTQMESFRSELRGFKGLSAESWQQAAQFAADHNVNLGEALEWSDRSLTGVFIGENNFKNFATKAEILKKLGKTNEADEAMRTAMSLASMEELHQYGRHLLQQKRNKEALDIFKANFQKNGNTFTTCIGLARGYAAVGDHATALKNAKLGLLKATNPAEKDVADKLIADLKEVKGVNQ
jgi:tetratricopeptide (TPR) repeat protein